MKNLFYFLTILFITNAQAQCGVTTGCNSNTGILSNNDAANIAYDNMGCAFHASYIHEASGNWKVWGEYMQDGTANALTPRIVNNTNYPGLTGTIYKMAIGSIGGDDTQLIVLTSTGLHALGEEGRIVDGGITGTRAMAAFAVNGKADGLPTGVTPADVKMLFASMHTLIITTCTGSVWVLSQQAVIRGDGTNGNSTTWSQVMTAPGVPLSNIIVARGNFTAGFALKTDGTLWTWGVKTYLGDGSFSQDRDYATQMTLPAGMPAVKMIQMTAVGDVNPSSNQPDYSYYILGSDKKVYSLGTNFDGQLGDRTFVDRYTWVNAKNPDGSDINDAVWISANEHDHVFAGFSVIRQGGVLYTGGTNDRWMVGRTVDNGVNYLDFPTGVSGADVITFVEVGGHISAIVKQGTTNYGYVGHQTAGSIGNGSSSGTDLTSFNFTSTPAVSICGTVCVAPTLTTNSPVCSGQNAVFTIGGLPGDVVHYNINSGTNQTATITATNTVVITVPNVTSNQIMNLTLMTNTTGCNLILTTTATITVSPNMTVSLGTSTGPICLNATLPTITHNTTGATGIGTATGLPNNVTASWSGNTITISGTPTNSSTFNYSIPLIGGCGTVNATGTIIVNTNNTVTAQPTTSPICINTLLTTYSHYVMGAAGIGTVTGLPAGVSATWFPGSGRIEIAGTPTQAGTFNYSIPLTGGCGTVNATGTIIVTPNMTVSLGTSTGPICLNATLPTITHNTTGATGIGTATGLPNNVTASWSGNTITISGTPTNSGTFSYSILLTGGCGNINATGTIIVTPEMTVSLGTSTGPICLNATLPTITHNTTGATGIGTATGLPTGITAVWSSNTISISGAPTAAGTFNYSIPLIGGCGSKFATGTITFASCGIQKGISPNGDGRNESFDLTGFNVKQLNMYNRYGRIIYAKANYSNEWYGQSDDGNELPDGAYYYEIVYIADKPTEIGWIYINRENK